MNALAQVSPRGEKDGITELLGPAVEACVAGMAILENGRVIYANPALVAMLGYAHAGELDGRALHDIAPGLFDPAHVQPKRREADMPRSGAGDAVRKDEVTANVEWSGAGFRSRGREFQVATATCFIPPQFNELQVRESQNMEAIGRLVGGVSHDFNNLLTGITLCCELLHVGLDRKSRLRHYVQEIRSAVSQGSALTQQLIAVAQQRTLEPRLWSINETIRATRDLLTRLIGENIELATDMADDLNRVKIDPALVQQIILNLVLNARDAMPDGGRVTLRTRNRQPVEQDQEQKVELTVSDTGCGMDAGIQSRLFEPFFTTKKPGKGNGLGLATVYSIVKQANGDIAVHSETGKGTQVDVRFPRAVEQAEAQNVSEMRDQTPTGPGIDSRSEKEGKPL